MDKKDLKSDIIREKIALGITYIKDNRKFALIVAFIVIAIIIFYVINNNKNKEKLIIIRDKNSLSLIKQFESINSDSISILISEMPESEIKLILDLAENSKNNDVEKLKKTIAGMKDPDDVNNLMLKSFVYLCEGFIEENKNSKISKFKQSIENSPSYDLKVYISIEVINLYLSDNKFEEAKTIIATCYKDYDNLSNTAKNELDYIKGKVYTLYQ